MTSVNTNAAAITALRTLQATNQQLETTQSRISTGYKIGEAKDNAAYWAISTTLKSDNKALSTVKDALGLGAATVDVAYQSLTKVKDVLDEIKSKLVAATQDGVNKSTIQAEIASLQNQLTSISSSSNFSGENWLNVNSGDNGFNATKNVVASYTRDASGAVAIGTVAIDTSSMVLIDRKANAEGILDAGVAGNTNAGGLAALGNTGLGATSGSYVTADVSAATGFTSLANADTVQLSYTVDGVAHTTSSLTLSGIASSSAANSGAAIVAALQGDATFNSLATVSYASGKFTITSRTSGASSAATVTALNWVQGGTANNSTGATGATAVTTAGANAKVTMGTAFANATNGLALDGNDSLSFDLTVDGTATRVTINQNTINTVLGSGAAGKVTSAADFQAVLKEGLRVAGLSNVTVSTSSSAIVFQGGVGTSTTAITVTNVNASQGTNLLTFDMSTATAQQLTTYITAVNAATTKVTAAAALLGSVASRIDMQKTFVNTLMDTIDKGVSNLVDADMSEESTKLQALQVKQQLGTQALSIANQSAQSVLSLFRS